jgi:uncharacterized protein
MMKERTRVRKETFVWGDNCRYNSYASRIKEKFGGRLQKVSVNAGFTCPNRDGTLGTGGCIYCAGPSFVPSYCFGKRNIHQQIDDGIEFHKWRYRRAGSYLAYFQAYSNTYAPVHILRKIYYEALKHPQVAGIVISTRPDCIDQDVLSLLADIHTEYPVFVEIGIESCFDRTLDLINRKHNFRQSVISIQQIAAAGIPVTGHLIFGLPGESYENMIHEAEIISVLPLTAVKFHQLQVLKNTAISKLYMKQPELFHSFDLESYIMFIIDFLERLNPVIAVDRLAGEVPPRFGVMNSWGNFRTDILYKKTESVMEIRKTCQGNKFKKPIKIPSSNN